jgi:hypothetical protein
VTRRRLRGPFGCCAGGVVGLALLLVAVFGLDFVSKRIDEWRHPWGYPAPGRPALVGTWVGTLVTGGGQQRGLLVDVRLRPAVRPSMRRRRVRRDREHKLEGSVSLCAAPKGAVQRYTAHGTHDDARASRFHLSLSAADERHPDGLAPSHLRGLWDGGDSLSFEADVHLRKGASAITSSDDPDTGRPARAQMRRGSEADLRSLCAALER